MAPVTMDAVAVAAACLSKPPREAATWTKSAHAPPSSADVLTREMMSSRMGLGRPLAYSELDSGTLCLSDARPRCAARAKL